MTIKDSGERREFSTGAVRDITLDKGRCDLMPLDVVGDLLGDDISGVPVRCVFDFQETGDTEYLFIALENFAKVAYDNDIPTMLIEVSKHFSDGAKKYGEHNWQKGIPCKAYIDSSVRHYLKWLRGDNDEPHDRAFVWNVLCCIWTCKHKPEMMDGNAG